MASSSPSEAAVTSEYFSSPVLLGTMPRGPPVRGVTVLFDEVFLVRYDDNQVEVYDSKTLTLQRHLTVKTLVNPWDMTSSVKFRCLYISDVNEVERRMMINYYKVHRVELNGNTTSWWRMYNKPEGVSVTRDGCNVIVTCREVRNLQEYTTHGDFVREISLQDDVIHPLHAVQLSRDQFVVCHGEYGDPLHRVCIVDITGRVRQSYGGSPGARTGVMNYPAHLAVDEDDNIMVADCENRRVLLMSRSLDDVRELISSRDLSTEWDPDRLCLHETRLYVTGYSDLRVFQVK